MLPDTECCGEKARWLKWIVSYSMGTDEVEWNGLGSYAKRLLGAGVPFFFEGLPDDGESEALEAVCDDTSAKPSAEEADNTICIENHANGLGICNWDLIGLLGGLDDTKTIAAAVGHD